MMIGIDPAEWGEALAAALTFTLYWEGGAAVTEDPRDPGGLTKWGLSARANPDLDIRTLTLRAALEVYEDRYWNKLHLDDLPQPLGMVLFDGAVNSGVARAARWLQKELPGVKVDGQIGQRTLDALDAALGHRRNPLVSEQEVVDNLCRRIILQRSDFLCALAAKNPSRLVYIKGWMRRTHSLAFAAGDYHNDD